MRQILSCTDNDITIRGEGIEYKISRSAIIVPYISIEPKLMGDIKKNLDQLSRIDPRSARPVQAFKTNLISGKLTLKESGGYGWLNSWCYTQSHAPYGEGHNFIKSLEKTLFGFEIEEKIWGEKDGKRVNHGIDHIFNLASKKIHNTFGPCLKCQKSDEIETL